MRYTYTDASVYNNNILCVYRRFYYRCTRVNRQMDMFVLPPRARTISISYSRHVYKYYL